MSQTSKVKSQKSKRQKSKVSIDELLTKAGFQTVEKQTDRILYASGAAALGKSHAAFLKAAGKHPEFIGASPFGTGRDRILIVHRLPSTSNEQPATEEQRDS